MGRQRRAGITAWAQTPSLGPGSLPCLHYPAQSCPASSGFLPGRLSGVKDHFGQRSGRHRVTRAIYRLRLDCCGEDLIPALRPFTTRARDKKTKNDHFRLFAQAPPANSQEVTTFATFVTFSAGGITRIPLSAGGSPGPSTVSGNSLLAELSKSDKTSRIVTFTHSCTLSATFVTFVNFRPAWSGPSSRVTHLF